MTLAPEIPIGTAIALDPGNFCDLDLYSLGLNHLVIQKIRHDPLFDRVKTTLERWRQEATVGKRTYFNQ